MINIWAAVSHDGVGIKLAILLIKTWILLIVASTRNRDTSETLRYLQLLLMTTVLALNGNLGCSNSSPASISDDARDNYKLAYKVALKVSQHARMFITVNLHLEQRNRISLLKLLAEIVSFINLLHCFLELNLNFAIPFFLQQEGTLQGTCGDSETTAHRNCSCHPYQPWGNSCPCLHCSGVVLYSIYE